jgi:D-alanyl-D-alanine endopeptidase (penicillin-binding protein 7)
MQANMAARSVVIILLDSVGKYTRLGDANRIRKWLELGDDAREVRAEASPGRRAALRQSAAVESHASIQLTAPALR